ncbi:lytic transglycosylase domain-containing protein [Streptomyces sp. NBC_01304]|uniref:lytic transglycosylase domain-containing protein n=1 Tax=Streptomyces sp. NBC_01304 TaxID=2903818 RepID=UPI002E14AD53|nr:lytic transglycosylase domain-containing protein [Streptomyces sp. NBC_01304]
MLCLAVLAAALTTAGVQVPTADAEESAPGPGSPQAQPRGDGRLELPGLTTDPPGMQDGELPDGAAEIPGTALDAYQGAVTAVAEALPGCKLPWELVASIGRVESVHASGYGLRADGTTEKPIRGPRLDGNGFALIRDTDGGKWDGDTEYDRAVGPMQFIPSTWAEWGADGNGDGERNPNNIYDAALGAGLYLCAGGRDLSKDEDLDKAVLSYNRSREYVNTVLGWMRTYQGGVHEVPDPSATDDSSSETPAPSPSTQTAGPSAPPSSPSKPASPSKPQAPNQPGTPDGTEGANRPSTPPAAVVTRLEPVGDGSLEAEAGSTFAVRPQVRALKSDGTVVAHKLVMYEIAGATGARFDGGRRQVTVTTDGRGIATAPRLRAGDQPGTFTIRASLGQLPDVTFDATVRPRPTQVADQLIRITDEPLQAPAGGLFDAPLHILATAAGKPVAGVRITASLEPVEGGPFFKEEGAAGRAAHSVVLDPPGADGQVAVPEIAAGDHPGTYTLVLTTPEGVRLEIPLTVTETVQ